MSYTLRGRIESRLVAALLPVLLALAVHRWWAIEVVALMLALGAALDLSVYDRALPYQPGWFALPLGALELTLVYTGVRLLGIDAPLDWALLLFGVAWLSGIVIGHALLPLLRLEYAESGGEVGRAGIVTSAAVALTLVCGLAADYAVRPPTIHLHGTVHGPLVIRHPETLVGGVVTGGIMIRADHVTLSHVTVVGGTNGIDVEHAQHVILDHVRVVRVTLDAIHVLDAGVMIHDCSLSAPAGPWVQGINISYSMGRPMSMISGCSIVGVRTGIITHASEVDVRDNHLIGTTMNAISLNEMSMGMASGNNVEGPKGVGIVCADRSMCRIDHNTIVAAKVDGANDPTRHGVAIEALFYAEAQVRHNTIIASPGGVQAFQNSTINETTFHP